MVLCLEDKKIAGGVSAGGVEGVVGAGDAAVGAEGGLGGVVLF